MQWSLPGGSPEIGERRQAWACTHKIAPSCPLLDKPDIQPTWPQGRVLRIAVLVNPDNTSTAEAARRDMPEAARALGVTIEVLDASTSREIEAAFAVLVRNRADALFVAADNFLNSPRVQFATLATRHGVPSAFSQRAVVEAGGLMSYGTDNVDMWRQVGAYTGQILKGAKPADLPVLQSTKFEFVINLQTARALCSSTR